MLRTIGLVLIGLGFAMILLKKLVGLRSALKPEKLERNVGDDIVS
jgi:hypothetical protein